MRASRLRIRLVLAFGLVALLGCAHMDPFDHVVQNATDEPLVLYASGADGPDRLLAHISPRLAYPLNLGDKCSTFVLVARPESGTEVARRTEPLCKSDTWVISAPSASG